MMTCAVPNCEQVGLVPLVDIHLCPVHFSKVCKHLRLEAKRIVKEIGAVTDDACPRIVTEDTNCARNS